MSGKEYIVKPSTTRSLTGIAILGGLIFSGNVQAEESYAPNVGPYVSFGAGITMPQSETTHIVGPSPGPGLPTTDTLSKFSWGTGYNIVAATGWKSSSGFRPEIEFGWRSTDLHRVNGANWSGEEHIFGVMANLLYDINTGSAITPYLGGGVGAARNRFENITGPNPVLITPPVYTGHDTNFQWQLIGGASVPISRHVALFAEYRYIRLDDNRIHSRSNAVSEITGYDDKSHNVIAGVRISFGGPEEHRMQTETTSAAPPPPPPPPPAPAPAPPPVPQKTLAFFDFDKSNLREDAKHIVHEAADFARNNEKTIIRVTGHTDTSGSVEYNLALSKRRAMAVKAELIRLGIPESEISVAWKGKSEPLVQTGDGVKEPQNRRVEIIYE